MEGDKTSQELPFRSKILTAFGSILYMLTLGTVYTIGAISPYIASYFAVDTSSTQLLMPSLIFAMNFVIPFGAQLASYMSSKWLILIASSISIVCTFLASIVPRTNFMLFAIVFVGGLSICVGLSYPVPIKLVWRAFP